MTPLATAEALDLAFRITDNHRALVVPIGVICAALITYFGVRSTNKTARNNQAELLETQRESLRQTFESQKLLARDDRLWKERVALYSAAAEAVNALPPLGVVDEWMYLKPELTFVGELDSLDKRLRLLDGRFAAIGDAETRVSWHSLFQHYHVLAGQARMFKSEYTNWHSITDKGTPDAAAEAAASVSMVWEMFMQNLRQTDRVQQSLLDHMRVGLGSDDDPVVG